MTRKTLTMCAALAAATTAFLLSNAAAQREGERKPKAEPKKPATHKVEKKAFRIELAVKGTLEPESATLIAYRPSPTLNVPHDHSALVIRKIVEHGAAVKTGDILVEFDTRKMDQVIAQMESEAKLLETSLALAKEEQAAFEKSAPHDLQAAERGKREADEDLAYYLKTGKGEIEKRAEQMLRYATFYYDFAKEQLRQLEKMYKANDLTEDTEQIILKRQRFFLEEASLELKQAKIDRDYVFNTILPRREKGLRDHVVRHGLMEERARTTAGPLLAQKQQAMVKMQFDLNKLRSTLQMVKGDRETMRIAAVGDGIVYYGKMSKGHWEAGSARLVPGGTVMPDEVFLTVVKARPLHVRLQVDEKDAHWLKPGLAGKTQLVFDPERKLPARVVRVSAIPATPGKFVALVAVDVGKDDTPMPGMACTVKFVPYVKKDALVLPVAAVFEEDDKHYVERTGNDGRPTRHEVRVGRTSDGRIEILAGLRAGDEVLAERGEVKAAAPKGRE